MQKSVVNRIFSVCFRKQSFLADYIKYISFLLLRCNIISSRMINLFSWTSIFSTHSSNLMIKWSLACCCAFTGCSCHGLCYYFSEIFIIWGWEWSSTAGHLLSTGVVLYSPGLKPQKGRKKLQHYWLQLRSNNHEGKENTHTQMHTYTLQEIF